MSDVVISVENLTKQYRLGVISHRTLQRDIQSWWARLHGRDDPNLPVDGGRRKKLEMLADKNGVLNALSDVSFEVRQGEVLGIIGKNGAGKSTLLKILSRVTAPTSGCVKIKGRIGSLLEVGTGFHPELTGRENIYMNGAILGMKRREIDRKLDEIIDFSGVEQFIDTPVKRYSSGMYVRLAFAVAAHLDPEILIIDEVLAVGDAEFQKKCLGKMGDVSKKEGRTVLFVSHNMAAVQNLCRRSILLVEGGILGSGETSDIIERYLASGLPQMKYSSDGYMDLSKARTAKYEKEIFKKIRILNEKGEPTERFSLMKSLSVEVILANTEFFPTADYCIAIHSSSGQWITSYATWMYDKHKVNAPRRILLNIPKILLSPGRYKIYLSATKHLERQYIDRIESAATLYVESSDVFSSGREFTIADGVVLHEGILLLERL